MISTKRARNGDESRRIFSVECEGQNDKRRKLDKDYSFQALRHWFWSKLPTLASFSLTSSEKKNTPTTIDFCSTKSTESDATSGAWTFVQPQTIPDSKPRGTADASLKASLRRKRKVTASRHRASSSFTVAKSWPLHKAGPLPAYAVIEQNEKLDAKLIDLSDRLEELVKSGQEALMRSSSDFANSL